MINIIIDKEKCIGCGLCAELCPNEVLETSMIEGQPTPVPVRVGDCWACMTCVGKCPKQAISVEQTPPKERYIDGRNKKPFTPISEDDALQYKYYSVILDQVLKLRWKPVAISLIKKDDPLPHLPIPAVRL